jgi:FtsP/CotA-like multicopper oxidase with cupredoxin domain
VEPTPTNQPASPAESREGESTIHAALSRRGFLRVAGLTGVAAAAAACAPAAGPAWSFGAPSTPGAASAAPATAVPSAAASVAPSVAPSAAASAEPSVAPSPSAAADIPPGWTEHDIAAREVVRRYVGNLAPALKDLYGEAVFLKMADILGAADGYPELSQPPAFAQVSNLVIDDLVTPLKPSSVDGDVTVYDMTVDEIFHNIDELKAPVAALGYNKAWPGPTIRAKVGEKLRFNFTNNMQETTGVHFHGVEFDNFFQDGVPFVTQKPFAPGETYTYEFTADRPGSLMYHSHHNATDQVGRGLLGAFVVEDPDAPKQWDSEYIWISNDALGGFTINGHGFPATVPVIAYPGERVLVRFMNEGTMMHPWHSHGYKMHVIARDGYPLGSAAFDCDTLGVNPGERYDAVITGDRPGIWAFHCHILPHVEGPDGMFGMVSTLIVVPSKEAKDALLQAVASQYNPAPAAG